MNKLTKCLTRHVWCIVIIAVILLLATAIIAYETQEKALSLTASIVSIVLAMVVIFYTFHHSERSSRMAEQTAINMRDTKEALSDILRKAEKTEEAVKELQKTHTDKNAPTDKDATIEESSLLDSSPLIERRKNTLKADLKTRGMEIDNKTSTFLLDAFAKLEFIHFFDDVYNVIFGSQIKLLIRLESNKEGLNNNQITLNFYKPAAINYPEIYKNYNYELYIHYLAGREFIYFEEDVWKIKDVGIEFVKYLRKKDKLTTAKEIRG